MIKYNRDKRGTYNARIHKIKINDTCDTQNSIQRIKIHIRYDKYNKNNYIADIYRKTRDTHAQKYVNITNAINDIFPEINALHTKHIYRATAPYHKFIPQETDYTPPESMMDEYKYTLKRTERVKCIIYSNDKLIHTGIFRRTIDINGKDMTVTLHRADRSIQVRPYIPMADTIHGVKLSEIYAHDVEIYQI